MKTKFLALTLSLAMLATGCSAAWFSTFQGYLAIAAPAVINVLEIIALARGTVINPATLAKINGDSTALQSLAKSVADATSQNLPNACFAFNAGVKTFAADIPTLEQIGNIGNATTQAQVEDAIVLLQNTITEIETPIAACQGSSPKMASYSAAVAAAHVKSPSDFTTQYNTIMKRQGATKKYQVHIHGWLVRKATLGMAK